MTTGLLSPMPPSGSVGYAHGGGGQEEATPDPPEP